MKKISRTTVLLVITAAFLLQNVQAQQAMDTSKVYELDEVLISASRFEESPLSVGRNVTVITRKKIEESAYSSIADILSEQQSFHTVGDRQNPGTNQAAFLRNTNSNHYVIMIDGVRISDPSTNNNGVDLSEISIAGVERIEIVRGAHSTLYGSSAIGGVINIITQKEATPGIHANLNTQHGSLGGHTYSTSNDVTLNFTLENGLYANISTSQQYTPGLDATLDTTSSDNVFNPQDRDQFSKLDLMGKIGYKVNNLDIFASYRRAGQVSDVDQGAYSDDDNARLNFKRNLFSYGGAYSFSDRVSMNTNGYWSSLARDFVNDSSIVDTENNFDGVYTENYGEASIWENEITVTFEDNYSRLLIGGGNNTQTMNSKTYSYVRLYDFESITDLDSLNLKETVNSLFIHADLNGALVSNKLKSFSLVAGSRVVNHNEFGTHLSYEINPQVQVTSTTLAYGTITTGYNAPSLYQLNNPEKGFGAHTNRGNKNLTPENSISYELGWKQHNDRVQFNVSLFKTKVRDVIEYIYLWNGNNKLEDLDFSDYLGDTYINIAKQDIGGIELGLNIRAIPKFTIDGNITYTQSKLTFSPEDIDEEYTGGNHVQIFESGEFINKETNVEGLTRRPNMSATIKAGYQPDSRWSLSVTSRFVGDRDDIYYSADLGPFGALDRSEISSYNLTDVGARYRLSQYLAVGAKIENIFDTQYTEINGYRTRGRGAFLKASFSL